MKFVRIALAAALTTLAACSTLPVEFAEPAGARIRVGDREPATLPATIGVLAPYPADLVLDFDAPTLVGYGMKPERAAALVADGKARITGRIAVRNGPTRSAEDGDRRLRFAVPGAAIVRALESGERVRCWWPAEGERCLWFESGAASGSEWFQTVYGEKSVVAHTPRQVSEEVSAVFSGALIGLVALIAVVLSGA